ncbi:MAG: polysulfide reductase NrfD [Candidatus Thiodiazotropha sp. (ex Lucinoma kastoroae)]|nr:polysulfide reductase NrfD [Candidatus Thiodiazotropha sp. (ex Lucinoma kastoroae)]MCU7858592.1 polysulfide reductase NrfD [Candidatus Thiodiazotropha sp. (ex Lucinoma kastoroae)]
MSNTDAPLVGDSFKLGYRFQNFWDVPMATAFFFGELGAGTFLISMYFDFIAGMILGLISTGVGKPFFHLTHMGVPAKSWRAVLRPDRSWISRGLISIMVFVPFGMLVVLDQAFGWSGGAFLGKLVMFVTVAAALVVMTYQGFAMSHSSSISLWNTGLMPVSSMAYALLSGTAVTLLLANVLGGLADADLVMLQKIFLGLLVVTLAILLSLLHAAYHGTRGGQQSVTLLIKESFSLPFHGLVFGAGIVLPLIALWFGGTTSVAVVVAAIGVLIGFFSYRVLIFKAGVYEPQISFAARLGLR